MRYEEYIQSRAWFARRKAALAMQKVCQRCGAKERLEVHHRHYNTLGRETVDDLEVLCANCHGREHKFKHGRPDQGGAPRSLRDVLLDYGIPPVFLDR